jgi:YidC/Oxa1 family membrane protein insertase
VDLYSFAPIVAVLDTAYLSLSALVSALQPWAGTSSAAVAVVLLTVLVRAVLIPVGVSQVRAERTRKRLAPALHELRRRFGADPAQLQRKTMELYSMENASPLAGCLPLLFQAPVLSIVYGLFVLGSINGHGNALLDESLGGVPLGSSLLAAVSTNPTWQALLLAVVLLAVTTTVAALSRRTAVAQTQQPPPQAMAILSWMPFVTVIVVCVVPVAAAVYLATSTTWTLIERAILRARLR